MFRIKMSPRKSEREEGEKPFWISYSDMMTALMVLFLVSLTVALLAVTNEASVTEQAKAQREKEIQQLLDKIRKSTKEFPGVSINGNTIDFGELVRFDSNSHILSHDQARTLRLFMPSVLKVARDPLGEKWLRQVVVEGFADRRGTYLHNLNLSLKRSQRVLCTLLASAPPEDAPLSMEDKKLVSKIFLVGGYSFNSLKETYEESRRVEIKLQFLELNEKRPKSPEFRLDDNQMCPLD
jgi:outer membrane protein OmpA-like peptidoglycan-associated protein